MRRIICGTDLSSSARGAADVAAAMAARTEGELTLIHAVTPWEVEFLERPTVEAIRSQRRQRLAAEANRLRATGARVREELVLGAPHAMLVSAASREGADLIVVASLGDIATYRWVSGSISLRTAQRATVPTLVVRDPGRLTAWAEGERPLSVFLCYDFSPTSDAALRWINTLRRWGACDLTVSHVYWPPHESWRFGVTGRSWQAHKTPEARTTLEREIRERCEQVLGTIQARVKVVSSWGRADVHLNVLAKENDADLVVIGSNQRNMLDRCWMGSVSRGVIRHSRTNVVCVPGTYVPRPPRLVIEEMRLPVGVEYAETVR